MKILTHEQLNLIDELTQSYGFDYSKGYYWQIIDESEGYEPKSIVFVPKDFYDREGCWSDFEYSADEFLSSEDVRNLGLYNQAESLWGYTCEDSDIISVLAKYEPFFEQYNMN